MTKKRIEEWKIGKMEGWKDGRMEGWKDGRMEGWKDGRMEEWKNGAIFMSSNEKRNTYLFDATQHSNLPLFR